MIAVIADDLSGAAEIGGIGWQQGLRVEIITTAATPGNNIDLVCVDTDSRLCPTEEAAKRVKSTTKMLLKCGVTQFYKKVDSVLRGNVVVEIEALLQATNLKTAILCPANPSRGRIIREGHYYVNSVALHLTEFARDPAHPRMFSDALELLRPHGILPIGLGKPDVTVANGTIVLAEASDENYIRQWAAAVRPDILAAGGADFFRAIISRTHPAGKPSPKLTLPQSDGRTELFVCGSTSDSSRRFVESMRATGTPVFTLPPELMDGSDFTNSMAADLASKVDTECRAESRIVMTIGLPLVSNPIIARKLSDHLVKVAALVLQSGAIKQVYCEGGATAAALMHRMGWNRLQFVEELAPGVCTTRPVNQDIQFTMKPGTYEWPAIPAKSSS